MKRIASLSVLLLASTAFSANAATVSAHKTVKVDFVKGSTELTQASKTAIANAVTSMGATNVERDITIAAWSDKAYPMGKDAKLARADRNLADNRIDAIEDYIESMDKVDTDVVDTFNMARHTGYMANLFETKEAEVKGGGTAALDKTPSVQMLTNEIQSNGGPSKAVVVVTLDK